MSASNNIQIGIIGGGNMGIALTLGLLDKGNWDASRITISRRKTEKLASLKERGINVTSENHEVVENSDFIVLAILPQQFDAVAKAIAPLLDPEKHTLISILPGVTIDTIKEKMGNQDLGVIRAMPNSALAVGESMTCMASNEKAQNKVPVVQEMFNTVGTTLEIGEDMITASTALCACGTAFFLRTIRAASQGGVQIGFHADEALKMATQTAKGAVELLLSSGEIHPEREIDKVTSPRGCTIAGLNELEHQGFSSALIKGIIKSAEKAENIY